MNLRKFAIPEVIFGSGARHLAGRYAHQFSASKVLIVTDPGVIQAGWLRDIENSLQEMKIPFVVYDNVTPNPRAEEVTQGAEVFRKNGCDVIITLGGGSPMDCAKGIGIVSSNDMQNILQFEGVDKIDHPIPPMIFIPTTAGTSADVSQFCIIANRKELVKISIISKAILPDVALIDPDTTSTMDNFLTACTGIDALVHAIEAYVSIGSGPLTDNHALEAIRIIKTNLPPLLHNPSSKELREQVMLGSMKAGFAFSNASLGAVHAMAHSLGGYLDLPHGECNAMLLEHVIDFNFNSVPDRYRDIASALGISVKGNFNNIVKKKLINSIIRLKKQVGITKHLGERGVTNSNLPDLADKALSDACMLTNPAKANKRDLETIFENSI